MNKTIGFIGLGVMGFPMAGHLSKIFEVSVFNRSHSKSEKWKKNFSGTSYNSIKEISSNSEILILCVGNDKDVKEIICGKDGAIDFLKPGSIIIDHTTTSSDLTIELSSLLKPKKILIVEGILILCNITLKSQINYNVFLECSRDTRLKRRLERDTSERGRNHEDVIKLFENRLDKMHRNYVEPIKKECDLILNTENNSKIDVLIEIINKNLSEK